MERTTPKTHRIAVLTSGLSRGSNLRAIHSSFREAGSPAEIALAVITRRNAPVKEVCAELGIPCQFISGTNMATFESHLLPLIRACGVELIALAGFMRQLSPQFISACEVPILNIHPALLPSFGGQGMYGMNVHRAVFEAGEKVSGATVHRVDPLYDHGEIIAQAKVDISALSSPEEIAEAVLKQEHSLYGKTIIAYLSSLHNQ